MMTTTQSLALWEICRQGLPLQADEAAEAWSQGKHFELQGVSISHTLKDMIKQCNWEADEVVETA